jgi:Protein of unknown function (DUF3592)
VYRIFGGLFMLVGALQLILCLDNSAQGIAAASWPTTSGVIRSSYVREVTGGGGSGYIPSVTYSYMAGSESFLGTRIWLMEFSELPDDARRTVDNFPVGSAVKVYFDPKRPNQSLLRPGLSTFSWMWLGLSFTALLVGGGSLYFGMRRS